MLSCRLDLSEFHRQAQRTVSEIRLAVHNVPRMAAQEGAETARSSGRFNDRTGGLRRSIYAKEYMASANYARWMIVSPASYSKFIESGTRPHDIYPKAGAGFIGPHPKGKSTRSSNDFGAGRGHALRFVKNGAMIFARMVHHPGTRADPFMGPAMQKAESVMYREFSKLGERVRRIWKQ